MIGSNKKGFTLMEITIAASIFAVVVLIAADMFKLIMDGQRNVLAAKNTQESMRYALEVISREIRMAQKDVGGAGQCPNVANGKVYDYNNNDHSLNFKNTYGECVIYSQVNNSRFQIKRDDGINPASQGYITPDNIIISNLQFTVNDTSPNQPKVTIEMDVEFKTDKATDKSKMKLQTTISSRYYE